MEGDLSPEEIRSQKFEIVRRGYDRTEVDRFRDQVSVTLAAAVTELADLRERLGQAGISEIPDLKAELDAVSSQVAEVLDAAREAAEGMRSRASEDASRWRAEADKEARSHRTSAVKDAEQARKSAWDTGTELLHQAEEAAKKMLEDGAQDALFIRAEAEREALRLTGGARRDREESIRKARTEADRVLIEARTESDRILDTARQSAQNAQERARALEQRRTELMQELEAARLSIGQLEQEIDTRREALHAAADAPDAGVRVIKTGSEPRTDWVADDASVRIVPATDVPAHEPVDADAFIADVAALRLADTEAAPDAAAQEVELSAATVVEAAPSDDAEPSGDDATGDPPTGDEPEEPKEPQAPAAVGLSAAEAELPPAEPVLDLPPLESPLEPTVAREMPAVPDRIDDLFSRLRTEDDAVAADATGDDAPDSAAVAVEVADDDAGGEVAGADTDEALVSADQAPVSADRPPAVAAVLAADPFDLRDKLLLPIENRTLRSVKRKIVDLQNRVLEELRVAKGDWEPDRSMFVAAVSDDVARMNSESFVAGHAAAAELLEAASTPPPERPAAQAMVGEFVDSLVGSVVTALKQARGTGGGSRQISAAAGRVFRAWRTDEAERRLRHAGYTAYNMGLLGAYPELDVDKVVAVAPGSACGRCPAGSDVAWTPGGKLPPGTKLPPAQDTCRATIVPAS